MDEVRAAYGLLNLKQVDQAILARQHVAQLYRQGLANVPGIRFMNDYEGVRHNYAYFPVFIDSQVYGMTRDELYLKMQEHNIFGRRYFYPLISEFSTYRGLPSADPTNIPVAHQTADSVICLPIYHDLSDEEVYRIIDILKA